MIIKKLGFACLTSLLIILFSCSLFTESDKKGIGDDEEVDISHFSIENYPRVDGSTSCHPLQRVIACEILDVDYRWYDWDGMLRVWAFDDDPFKKAAEDYINNIQHSGTHGSYVNLINDSVDVIIAARLPSEDELALAAGLQVEILTEAIALDAFVFILNTQNPVNNLTIEQIRGIYSGVYTNWNDVGGINAAINPYQRNRNSGSQELMDALVMQGLQMVDAPQMVLNSMMGPINKLNEDPHGIGYTVYFFNTFMAPRDNIKLCAVNGVHPGLETISSGSYVFTAKVYTAIRSGTSSESTAYLLWKWLQTREGQKAVGLSGYVPYSDI